MVIQETHTHTHTQNIYEQNTNQHVPCLLHTLNKSVLTQECLKTIIYLLSEESSQQIQLLDLTEKKATELIWLTIPAFMPVILLA